MVKEGMKMARQRKYEIELTVEERALFKKLSKKAKGNKRTRYLILLAADAKYAKKSQTYKDIADKVGVSEPTVINTLKQFCDGGIQLALEAKRSELSNVSRLKADGEFEARIIAKACSTPPKGYSRWTLDLLEEAAYMILEEHPEFGFDTIDRSTIARVLNRNEVRPHLTEYWCIPPEADAEFVANMEDILDVYALPPDDDIPLWCMDEKPYQLLDHARNPIPMRAGDIEKIDSEYKREGTVSIFCFTKPHLGTIIPIVEETRTAVDWAEKVKYLVDVLEPNAKKILLVMDNLNTHSIASLYKAFPPAEARRIARKLEVHYTPKHGSWLDIAEIAINIMTRQCLGRRIPSIDKHREELKAWETDHNEDPIPINWQFTNEKARIKLSKLYPDIEKYKQEREKRKEEKQRKNGEKESVKEENKQEENQQKESVQGKTEEISEVIVS